MKWLALLFVCFGATAFAQNDQNLLENSKRMRELKIGTKSYVSPFVQESFREKLVAKPFKPEAVSSVIVTPLRQDNMPCIVPDMRLHKTMPNAGNDAILKQPIDPGIYAYRKPGTIRVAPTK